MEEIEVTRENEREMWFRYKETADGRIREKILIKYTPLVKHVCAKICDYIPPGMEFNDLVNYGIFGLIDAVEKFEPKRGLDFKTYAINRIRGAIYDELRNIDWIPRTVRANVKAIERAYAEFELKHGRLPKDEEVAVKLGISVEQFRKQLVDANMIAVTSLDDVWFLGGEDSDITVIDTVESKNVERPEASIIEKEVKEVLAGAIEQLPETERNVIGLYYYEELTLKEIGEVLNLTESRISQIHSKAIIILRSKLRTYRDVFMKKAG